MTIKFAEQLQRYLLSVGIDKIYGVIGREASAISFTEVEGFEFVLTRHEMTAGVMAAAISRFTFSPQVCFGTLGPGITNYMTALATATLDRYPVIFIVAQIETSSNILNDAHQCIDNIAISKPLCKYAYELKSAKELKSSLENALSASMTYPYGPSVISIPIDILSSEVEIETSLNQLSLNPSVLDSISFESNDVEVKVNEMASVIKNSENPLIVIGDTLVKTEGATEMLRSLVRKTNIPVISTYSAKGVMQLDSPLNLGVINSYSNVIVKHEALESIFNNVDTVILLGYDLSEHYPFAWTRGRAKIVLNLNSFNNNIYKAVNPKINLVCPLNKGLKLLESKLKNYKNASIINVNEVNNKIETILTDRTEYQEGILHPQILNSLNEHFHDNYILANDIGMHRHLSSIFFKTNSPLDFITSAGLSSFGTGLSLGMGAKIANPSRNVVVVAGDGGFHSNNGDLETIVRLGLKILIVVMNSHSNALIERYQLVGKDRKINKYTSGFNEVDFTLIAKANGCASARAGNLSEFRDLLKVADFTDGPFLIEVPIYYPEYYINEYSKINKK